jgi:hypothetical protein
MFTAADFEPLEGDMPVTISIFKHYDLAAEHAYRSSCVAHGGQALILEGYSNITPRRTFTLFHCWSLGSGTKV